MGDFTARQWATVTPTNDYGLAAAKSDFFAVITTPTAGGREQRSARLFYTLGHMMHLVEDMAQPQHTRNDAHPTSDGASFSTDGPKAWLDALNLWSRYENWCRDHLASKDDPVYLGYPMVFLPSYGSYFNNGDGEGMAEYSNRNFVTEHTNYSDPVCPGFEFQDPYLLNAFLRTEVHSVSTESFSPDGGGATIDVVSYEDHVLSYPTYDAYTATTTINRNHSFYSIYDYELKKLGKEPVFSLPESALASQAALLVPRAVGYAAGLLDHFFRGQVDVKWTQNGDRTYDVTLKNLSMEPLSNFHVTAFYRVEAGSHGATGDLVKALDQQIDGIVIAPNDSYTFSAVAVPGLEANESVLKFERRIAVVGTLGSEPEAVIGLVQPPSQERRLRAEVDWPAATNSSNTIIYLEFDDLTKSLDDRTFNLTSCGAYGQTYLQIPDSTISPPGTKPLVIGVDPVPGDRYFALASLSPGSAPCDGVMKGVRLRLYLDDVVIQEQTADLSTASSRYFIYAFYTAQ